MVAPYRETFIPNDVQRRAVAYYWRSVLQGKKSWRKIEENLPQIMGAWGKIRLRGGDTTVCGAHAAQGLEDVRRQTSFIRYDSHYTEGQAQFTVVNYGEMMAVLVCCLPDQPIFGKHRGSTNLLALVEPCNTDFKDARKEPTSYKQKLALVAIDVRNITAVIGRVQSRGKWWIVDRFDSGIIPTFDELNEKNYDTDSESDVDDA
ncbi:hypothetical protein BKA70DRAFT_1115872 [Coprinopsis sp. MPI-PUGE-AT-0042]|nr:hypothetical protein BKA70DRAFT_1115872 [Coprinopsis sp. MPI-PUGE-AT-0042]